MSLAHFIRNAIKLGLYPPQQGGPGVTLAEVIGALYPVGALKFSADNVDPGTYLAGTTWAAWGSGRVLVGYAAGDTDFDAAEETGGAKTQTPSAHAGTAVSAHSGAAVADHAAHTHSVISNVAVADHAAHTHSVATGSGSFKGTSAGGFSTVGGAAPGSSGNTGNPSATLSHAVTNNATTSGNPSATLSHSVSQPSNHTVTQPSDHSAMSVVQPYIVGFMWKRTA